MRKGANEGNKPQGTGKTFTSREGKGEVRDGSWTGIESHAHEIEKV